MQKKYYVYIITNWRKTVLYTGVTNNLYRRIREHYANKGKEDTFAGKYYCYWLLHYEEFSDINVAIEREKAIKSDTRDKKEVLIKEINPDFNFLNVSLFGEEWYKEPLDN